MAGEPLQSIKALLPELTGATRRVADLILTDPERAGRSSITSLAAAADTSPATLTRLAGTLGHDGFPALRAAIATEHGRDLQAGWERDIGTAITPADPADRVLDVLAGTHAQALRSAVAAIDLAAAERLADAITGAGRISIFGEWGDAIPAEELQLRLLRIGRPAWFHRGRREAAVAGRLLGPRDVALVISRSGRHPDAAEFLRLAGAAGAITAVITGMTDSPLARASDLVIDTGIKDGPNWTDYFAGRATDALAAGLIFVLVAQRTPDSLGIPIQGDETE
ncbi:MurR/RpiR family transcriptional regulator [Microlunatus speluncae]|uniref:MurR/RpiR family transcriptional regulator n=1 Tax=Microlunatus speluncae TaxID=2594267 RepID=UPI0012667C32|nr:MurR/RpiR family transcriptional regulator [Microlunatus speluncae]